MHSPTLQPLVFCLCLPLLRPATNSGRCKRLGRKSGQLNTNQVSMIETRTWPKLRLAIYYLAQNKPLAACMSNQPGRSLVLKPPDVPAMAARLLCGFESRVRSTLFSSPAGTRLLQASSCFQIIQHYSLREQPQTSSARGTR